MSEAESAHQSLSDAVRAALVRDDDRAVTLGALVDSVGDKGFGLLLILLSLPSALPVPAPGYSTPFGIALMIISVQIMAGRHTPWLPEGIRRASLSPGLARRVADGSDFFFRRVETLIRPRLRWLTQSAGRVGVALLVMFMAALMILPIPGTNTAPAMVVFLVGVALSEEDGLFAGLAALAGLAAAGLYIAIILMAFSMFDEHGFGAFGAAFEAVKDWIRALIGAREAG